MTNAELVEPFTRAGFEDVAAYQAAGNISFRCDDEALVVDGALDALLGEAYGFPTPTFVRRADELRAIVEACPFTADQISRTEGRVQLTFLRDEPDAQARASVADVVPADDLVAVVGRQWFWLPRVGVSTSRLPVAGIERLLGPMTMRGFGTVQRMLLKFGD